MSYCPATESQPADLLAAPDRSHCKVAYIMSRFPELTQTFVLFELLAVEQAGVAVEVFPLLRGGKQAKYKDGASIWTKMIAQASGGKQQVMHPEAAAVTERAHYAPVLSLAVLSAQVYFLLRRPTAYLGALWTILRGAWGSTNFLVGGLAIFPKSVYFARRMEDLGITHIHAHFANHPSTAALIIHRLTGIPYSFTAHGSDLHRERRLLKEKVAEAAFVVPISKYNRDVIQQHCGNASANRLKVIHCGVDTAVFQPARRSPQSDRALKLLSVGTLHEVKGQRYLIEACRQLRMQGVEFECNLVGDGPDRSLLTEQIEQAKLDDCVHLLGQRTRQEIASLMQQADIFVAPSVPSRSGRREGIPVVLMEAMASGAAVVASDLSGIPELVTHEESGLLVPPGQAADLAAALQQLYHDGELRCQLGVGGRETVLSQFNQRQNATFLAQCFSESSSS